MRKDSSEIIQAFPIQANTFIGTPSSFVPNGHNILHATADSTVSFTIDGTTLDVEVSAGQDLAFDGSCSSITATDVCWIS